MRLADAIEVKPGDVVSFVGAGGKTTALFRLADELAGQGWRVVTTTTTRMAQSGLKHAPQHMEVGRAAQVPSELSRTLHRSRHVFIFGSQTRAGKVQGVDAAWLDEHLARLPDVDALLVEADGSRRLPIKAPLAHEPPIPASSTVVIPVVGLTALDQPLDDAHVYGAEAVCRVTGYSFGTPVSERLIATLLTDPELGLKNISPQARVIPLLNQVSGETLSRARRIAADVLANLRIDRVLVGAVQEADPVREIRRRVGAVILAAGESKRMGKPKMLLPWGDSTMIRHVCQQAAASGLATLVVVAGKWLEEIEKQVSDLPLQIVLNPDYAAGEMLSSLKVGLNAVRDRCDACLVILGDQPDLQPTIIQHLLDVYAQGEGRIIAPSYNNRRGHPVLIDRAFWQQIIDLPAGQAPRDVLRANEGAIIHVVVETDAILRDIDTPDDYKRARREASV